jgi:hypothetical protein
MKMCQLAQATNEKWTEGCSMTRATADNFCMMAREGPVICAFAMIYGR